MPSAKGAGSGFVAFSPAQEDYVAEVLAGMADAPAIGESKP